MKLALLMLMILFFPLVSAADNASVSENISLTATLTPGTDRIVKTGIGTTPPGIGWQPDAVSDVYFIDVDTRGARFSKTPIYVASLTGLNTDIALGATAIYSPTKDGFRIYVRNDWGSPFKFTLQDIQNGKWSVQWIGVEPR